MIETLFIQSKYLERKVEVRLYRPKQASDIYLYFFDGQNIFDIESTAYGMSWDVLPALKEIGLNANVIGIHSLSGLERILELMPGQLEKPYDFEEELSMLNDTRTKGRAHGKFIVEELMPLVELRPAKDRLIAGSSMGGLASLYMGAHYPDLFKKVLAMSTAAFIAPKQMGQFVGKYDKKNKQSIYMDVGTEEAEDKQTKLAYILVSRLVSGFLETKARVKYIEEIGADHNEIAWARRLPQALTFLFEDDL